MKRSRFWLISLRGGLDSGEGVLASVDYEVLAFNTLKFMSASAALAHARRKGLDPQDYVLVLAEFTRPTTIEVREIDYSASTLAVAVDP